MVVRLKLLCVKEDQTNRISAFKVEKVIRPHRVTLRRSSDKQRPPKLQVSIVVIFNLDRTDGLVRGAMAVRRTNRKRYGTVRHIVVVVAV